jgi:hypothetical protein
MKNSKMQEVFDTMRKTAEQKYPEKNTAREQYEAYGKIGLLIFCQNRGLGYGTYHDLLEAMK